MTAADEKIAAEHIAAGLTPEIVKAHYQKMQHQDDECQLCHTIVEIAAEALSHHTERAPKGEPVAWVNGDGEFAELSWKPIYEAVPLYAHPHAAEGQQVVPVEPTEEIINTIGNYLYLQYKPEHEGMRSIAIKVWKLSLLAAKGPTSERRTALYGDGCSHAG